MSQTRDFVLDTNIVLHYARQSNVSAILEKQFQLRSSPFSPLVCVVTLGEIRAIAYRQRWNESKLRTLDAFLSHLVVIDISSPDVIDAYARILVEATTNGWGIHQKKNDLWIAAVTHVLGATLLTTDADFDPLRDGLIDRIRLDAHTGAILP